MNWEERIYGQSWPNFSHVLGFYAKLGLDHGGALYLIDHPETRFYIVEQGKKQWNLRSFPIFLKNKIQSVSIDKKSDTASRIWFYSFTKITGLFSLGNSFLVTYQNPNPKHKWYAKGFSEIPQPEAQPFVLNLQIIDTRGQIIGPLRQLPGAVIMGITDKEIFTYHPSSGAQEHKVEIRPLSVFE